MWSNPIEANKQLKNNICLLPGEKIQKISGDTYFHSGAIGVSGVPAVKKANYMHNIKESVKYHIHKLFKL